MADIQNLNVDLSLKANLDEKIVFCNIPHLIELEIRKLLERDSYGNQDSTFQMSYPFLGLTMSLNRNVNAK